MTILLADDERLVRMYLQSAIEEIEPNQHKFIHAKNGKNAMDILETIEQAPDLAFVDLSMPFFSGIDILSRYAGQFPSTYWILLSGYDLSEIEKDADGIRVMLKPASSSQLRDILDEIHQRRR